MIGSWRDDSFWFLGCRIEEVGGGSDRAKGNVLEGVEIGVWNRKAACAGSVE